MPEVVVGTLEVKLKRATDLKDVEWVGQEQDPYVVLSVAGNTQRSTTHQDGGICPEWNETFTFANVAPTDKLLLQLYDENLVLADVHIGDCEVSLNKVAGSGKELLTVPVITKKGKQQGIVTFEVKYSAGRTSTPSHPSTTNAGTACFGFWGGPSRKREQAQQEQAWILPTYGGKDCWQDYDRGHVLGQGSFGTTYQAVCKATGEQVAVKVISRRSKDLTPELVDSVRREVQIMFHLAGHPNVVNLKAVYEDKRSVMIVMELCSGGDLYNAIFQRGRYSERDAAMFARAILLAVAHCHDMGVIHRDLKPGNFLLSDQSRGAVLKAADFGFSTFFREGQRFTDPVGTAHYAAPEVLLGHHGKESDLWSVGVILYMMLCGERPFDSTGGLRQVVQAVLSQQLDLNNGVWEKISDPAKDVVLRLLTRDPKKRATAAQILQHQWLAVNGCASDAPLQPEVLKRLSRFSVLNNLQRETLKVIATRLPQDETVGTREMFREYDQDASGTISTDEFARMMERKGRRVPKEELQKMLKQADMDGNGHLDYEEFLAVTMNLARLRREDVLRAAFQHFDADGSGAITRSELQAALAKHDISDDLLDDIISEADKDGDKKIDFKEFCHMMLSSCST